jgi:hypothetical protein
MISTNRPLLPARARGERALERGERDVPDGRDVFRQPRFVSVVPHRRERADLAAGVRVFDAQPPRVPVAAAVVVGRCERARPGPYGCSLDGAPQRAEDVVLELGGACVRVPVRSSDRCRAQVPIGFDPHAAAAPSDEPARRVEIDDERGTSGTGLRSGGLRCRWNRREREQQGQEPRHVDRGKPIAFVALSDRRRSVCSSQLNGAARIGG